MTANSNVYVDANYIISLDQQNKMNISYQYDLSKESDLTYNYYLKEINQLDEAVQTLQENEEKIQNILYIFNGKDNKKLISKTIDDFKTKMKQNLRQEYYLIMDKEFIIVVKMINLL